MNAGSKLDQSGFTFLQQKQESSWQQSSYIIVNRYTEHTGCLYLNSEGLEFCLAFRKLFPIYYSSFCHFSGFLSIFPYIDYYCCGLGVKQFVFILLLYISYTYILQVPFFLHLIVKAEM